MEEKEMTPNQESELERAVSAAREEWERETAERVKKAERMARMSEQERAEQLRQEREQALAERERRVTLRELRAGAMVRLREKQLPDALADALDYSDAARMEQSLDAVETAFRKAVQSGIEERMRGDAPRTAPSAAAKLTDEEYYRGIVG